MYTVDHINFRWLANRYADACIIVAGDAAMTTEERQRAKELVAFAIMGAFFDKREHILFNGDTGFKQTVFTNAKYFYDKYAPKGFTHKMRALLWDTINHLEDPNKDSNAFTFSIFNVPLYSESDFQ